MSQQLIPKRGLKGLKENWRNDLIAGISVSLVSLPLGIVISLASGAPPLAGVITAIIGGFVTTFLRGSHVSINGPGNTLILLVAGAMTMWGDLGWQYCLAAFITAGALQFFFGLIGLGQYGKVIPNSVIYGVLAAIGVILLGKQIHTLLGFYSPTSNQEYMTGIQAIDYFIEIPWNIGTLNPVAALIGIVSLSILIFHKKITNKLIHFIPSPIWVLIITIPIVFVFGVFKGGDVTVLGQTFPYGPDLLVDVPTDITAGYVLPDFSKIVTIDFWLLVISISLISSVEALSSAKAVEKLDPYKRSVNLNQDLMALGISTMLAGLAGGLPVVTVIARSSINVNHGARTSWSNFFQGVILVICILFFIPFINLIPKAALAAILIFTGAKLTSISVFKDALRKGKEQLFILIGTYIATLVLGLLLGILIGIALTLFIQLKYSKSKISTFLRKVFKVVFVLETKRQSEYIRIDGNLNFLNLLKIEKQLKQMPEQKIVTINFGQANVIGHTILEYIHEWGNKYTREGGDVFYVGLSAHTANSSHPNALHFKGNPLKKKKVERLSRRQTDLQFICQERSWGFDHEINFDSSSYNKFLFFQLRPVEFIDNCITGIEQRHKARWEIADVTFEEGTLMYHEEYHITVQKIQLSTVLPDFIVEREEMLDRLLGYYGYQELDYLYYNDISSEFLVKSHNDEDVRKVFSNKEFVSFLESEDIYHLECKENEIVVFKYHRLSTPFEILKQTRFSRKLIHYLEMWSEPTGPLKNEKQS